MGHSLIHHLAEAGPHHPPPPPPRAGAGPHDLPALALRPLDPELTRRCVEARTGDILDRHLLERLRAEFEVDTVFHLAALPSTRAEFGPETAHQVNVEGTLNLLRSAHE